MKNIRSSDWVHLVLFTFFGVIVFSAFYVFARLTIPPAQDFRDYYAGVIGFVDLGLDREKGVVSTRPVSDYSRIITLRIDEVNSVGELEVVFKGLETADRFKLEVAIPELDPDSFYSRDYSIAEARQGITIGSQKVRLLTARGNLLRLVKVAENG